MTAAALALLVFARGSAAGAATPDPISVDKAPVEVGAGGSGSVSFVNTSAVPLTVTGGVKGSGALVASVPSPVRPGQRATIAVQVPSTAKDPKVLVVVAPTAGLADGWTTELALTVAGTTKPKPPEPAVTSWRTTSYGGVLPGRPISGAAIPLKNAGSCGDVALADHTAVGEVQGNGRAVAVTAACQARNGRLFALVEPGPMSLDGVDYSGTIDLQPDDKDAGDVDLTIRRTTKPALFWVLLGIGILIAYGLRVWTGSGKTVSEQRLRLETLRLRITSSSAENPLSTFAAIARKGGLQQVSRWDLRTDLLTKLDVLGATLKKAGKPWRPNGKLTKAYKDAEASLAAAEAAVSQWPQLANLLVRLHRSSDDLSTLDTFFADLNAKTLGRPGTAVAVGDVEGIRGAAQLGVDVAMYWKADRYRALKARVAELEAVVSDNADFIAARAAAMASWSTFDNARKDARDLEQIKQAMSDLATANAAVVEAFATLQVRERESVSFGAGVEGASATTSELHRDEDVAKEASRTALRIKVRQVLTDSAVLAAIVVVALLAGAEALYVGKAYGGLWDYVSTVAWAFTAATVADPIAAAVQRLADGLTEETPAG